MKLRITKYVHSCLLVETADRVALFDPGTMSTPSLDLDALSHLDDVFITHIHADHFDEEFIIRLAAKFSGLRVTAPAEVVKVLAQAGVTASDQAPSGVAFFDSPHEPVEPLALQPDELGYHYLDKLSHPGDSHSFNETAPILALPITGPWGATVNAVKLAMRLKPRHVIPIHDWHWSDAAKAASYPNYARILEGQGIIFHIPEAGQPIEIDL